jgi:hypothetical protein
MRRNHLVLCCALFAVLALAGVQFVFRPSAPPPGTAPDVPTGDQPATPRTHTFMPYGAVKARVVIDGKTIEMKPGDSCKWEGTQPGQVMVVEP